jgi:hypothetical protein
LTIAPSGRIEPTIDGRVTTYFEWLGAGLCQPDYRSGSMHGVAQLVEALYYGYSDHALFLRLDLGEAFLKEHPDFEIRVNVNANGEIRARVYTAIGAKGVKGVALLKGATAAPVPAGDRLQAAFERVFELRLDYSALDLTPQDRISLQVAIWMNGLPLQLLPQEGWLNLELTEDLTAW